MIDKIEIRESAANDDFPIEELYRNAFPDENLLPLVVALLKERSIVLSLVGIVEEALAGHVIFTTCRIAESTEKVSLLAPLAVAPLWQRQGIGSAIVKAGLKRLIDVGTDHAFVLGDPTYYSRFGFKPDYGVAPPYRLPEEWRDAWQSLCLSGRRPRLDGTLSVPRPWRQKALWMP